jgi:hypothetical protein
MGNSDLIPLVRDNGFRVLHRTAGVTATHYGRIRFHVRRAVRAGRR